MQSQEFLTPLVEELRGRLGAEAVAGYFPSHGQAATRALRCAVGSENRVAELSSPSRMASLVAQIVRGQVEVAELIEGSKGQSPVIAFMGREPHTILLAFQSSRLTDSVHERRARTDTQRELLLRASAFIGFGFQDEASLSKFREALGTPEYEKDLNYLAQLGAFLVKADASQRDPLTGLPGLQELRRHYAQIAAWSSQANSPVSLLLLCPEDGGTSKALESIRVEHVIDAARELEIGARSSDFVARIGYCTFAVLLLDSTAHEGLLVGKRLLQAVSNAVELEDYLPLILKCGVSVSTPEESKPLDVLLEESTVAAQSAVDRTSKDIIAYQDQDLFGPRQVSSYHDYSSGTLERDSVWFKALFKIAEIVALNENSANLIADAHLEVLARHFDNLAFQWLRWNDGWHKIGSHAVDDGVSAEIVAMVDEAPVEGVTIGKSTEGGIDRYWGLLGWIDVPLALVIESKTDLNQAISEVKFLHRANRAMAHRLFKSI